MLPGEAEVAVASLVCGRVPWSGRVECVFSCLRSRSVRENRLRQSLQECLASFVSTWSQLPFTRMLPVCTYVRRAHAGQGSLVVSTSFGIVYTRAWSGDKVAVYAFSVWVVGDGNGKGGGEERDSGGVAEQRWRASGDVGQGRSCGRRSGVRYIPFGWSEVSLSLESGQCRRTVAVIYAH